MGLDITLTGTLTTTQSSCEATLQGDFSDSATLASYPAMSRFVCEEHRYDLGWWRRCNSLLPIIAEVMGNVDKTVPNGVEFPLSVDEITKMIEELNKIDHLENCEDWVLESVKKGFAEALQFMGVEAPTPFDSDVSVYFLASW